MTLLDHIVMNSVVKPEVFVGQLPDQSDVQPLTIANQHLISREPPVVSRSPVCTGRESPRALVQWVQSTGLELPRQLSHSYEVTTHDFLIVSISYF